MSKKFNDWMSRKNNWFAAIGGETFTNAEVVYPQLGLIVFLIILGLAGSIEYHGL